MEEKKLKIAIVNDVFYPVIDGVVRVVDNYATELSKLPNVEVTLVVPGPREAKDFDKYYKNLPYKVLLCKTSRLGFDGYNNVKLTREFKRKFIEEKFDIIHCHSVFGLYGFSRKIAKKYNIPLILTVHSQYRPDYKRYLKFPPFVWIAMKITGRRLNKCNMLFSINDKMDVYVRKEMGYKGKSRVVRNATHFIAPTPQKIENSRIQAREKYNIKDGDNVFIFVGRLLVEKGILIILRALNILKKQGIPFKMFYVGAGFDEKQLRAQIKALDLENDVIMTGRIESTDTLIDLFSISKLLLFPSAFDVDCLVKREAAACEVPTVFLRDTYTSAEVTDGINGYISDKADEAFAKKIIEIISDETARQKVARKAKETLFWSWDKAIAQVLEIYKEIIN